MLVRVWTDDAPERTAELLCTAALLQLDPASHNGGGGPDAEDGLDAAVVDARVLCALRCALHAPPAPQLALRST